MLEADDRDVLLKVADLIDRGWAQRSMAVDANGTDVMIYDEKAARFCAYGAVCRVAGHNVARRRINDALTAFVGSEIDEWNDDDGRTAAEVSAALRELATTVERP